MTVLTIILLPFPFFTVVYAMWDGLMYFDSAIRFGISRKSFFWRQLRLYVLFAILLPLTKAMNQISWTGSLGSYFSKIGKNAFSIEKITIELISLLFLAIVMLAIYRYKTKIFIVPLILTGLIALAGSFSFSNNQSFYFNLTIPIWSQIVNHKDLFFILAAAGLIGIYYLFITKIEIQR